MHARKKKKKLIMFNIGQRFRKPWSTDWIIDSSLYRCDSISSCTVMALECAMRKQLQDRSVDMESANDDIKMIHEILSIASMYKSDRHTHVDDVLPHISRYAKNLDVIDTKVYLLKDITKLIHDLLHKATKELKDSVSAIVTKPPESIFIHFGLPLKNEHVYEYCLPLIFDSHPRTEFGLHGSHILNFENINGIIEYLNCLWKPLDQESNASLAQDMYNMVEVNLIQLKPEVCAYPTVSIKELQQEFDSLKTKMDESDAVEFKSPPIDNTAMNSMANDENIKLQQENELLYDDVEKYKSLFEDCKHGYEAYKIKFEAADIDNLKRTNSGLIHENQELIHKLQRIETTTVENNNENENKEEIEKLRTENEELQVKIGFVRNKSVRDQQKYKEQCEANQIQIKHLQGALRSKHEELANMENIRKAYDDILNDNDFIQYKKLQFQKRELEEEEKQADITRIFSTFECCICMCEHEMMDVFELSECHHQLCRVCAAAAIMADVRDRRQIPRCPLCLVKNTDNPTTITEQSVVTVLQEKDLQQYYKIMEAIGAANLKLFHCLTPNCSGKVDVSDANVSRFDCHCCHVSNCIDCRVQPYHSSQTCVQFQTNKKAKESQELEDLKADLKKEGILPCPNCGNYVDRIEGCNHITCICKTHFCCLCGDKLPNTKPQYYQHFNDVNNKCVLFTLESLTNIKHN